ncbi:MAG: DUF1048 domain-containing protein [Jatrophihabitans sp.]
MTKFLTTLIGDKQAWKAMESRANALPRDYRIVYGEIKAYLWKITTGDGMHTIAVLDAIIGAFEAGAGRGETVGHATGENVAAFCDARMGDARTYLDRWRGALNADVASKLAQ